MLVSAPDDALRDARVPRGRDGGPAPLGSNAEDTLDLVLAVGRRGPRVRRPRGGRRGRRRRYALVEEGRVDAIFATKEAATAMELAGMEPAVAEISEANPLLGAALATTTRDPRREGRRRSTRYLAGWRRRCERSTTRTPSSSWPRPCREDWDLPQLDDPEARPPIIETIAGMWFSEGDDNLLRNVPEHWEAGRRGLRRAGDRARRAPTHRPSTPTTCSTRPRLTPGLHAPASSSRASRSSSARARRPSRPSHGIDLTIARRRSSPSSVRPGCGKTTLLRILAGLTPPSAGQVRSADRPVWAASRVDRDGRRATWPWCSRRPTCCRGCRSRPTWPCPLRLRGVGRAERRGAGPGDVRAHRHRRLRAPPPVRAVGRDAPAGGHRPGAHRRAPTCSCSTSPSPPSTPSPATR